MRMLLEPLIQVCVQLQFCASNPANCGASGRGGAGCFNCGELGHRAAECPMNQPRAPARQFPFRIGGPEARLGFSALRGNSNSESNEPCLRCGRRGHRSVECPSGREVCSPRKAAALYSLKLLYCDGAVEVADEYPSSFECSRCYYCEQSLVQLA